MGLVHGYTEICFGMSWLESFLGYSLVLSGGLLCDSFPSEKEGGCRFSQAMLKFSEFH